VPADGAELIAFPKVLNNYLRKNSHRLWGFNLVDKFVSGFSPIVPVNFANHQSQVNKKAKIFPFAS
jgi:hypothetical protein